MTTDEQHATLHIAPKPPLPPAKAQIKKSEIHRLFQEFYNRDDVQQALAKIKSTRRANLLKTSFFDETGLDINLGWVYKVLKCEKLKASLCQVTVKIGDREYSERAGSDSSRSSDDEQK
jgi:hypothetical protein